MMAQDFQFHFRWDQFPSNYRVHIALPSCLHHSYTQSFDVPSAKIKVYKNCFLVPRIFFKPTLVKFWKPLSWWSPLHSSWCLFWTSNIAEIVRFWSHIVPSGTANVLLSKSRLTAKSLGPYSTIPVHLSCWALHFDLACSLLLLVPICFPISFLFWCRSQLQEIFWPFTFSTTRIT